MNGAAVVELVADYGGPIQVIGSSALADEIRRLLSDRGRLASDQASPGVIIETTGEPAAIEGALGRVADLGTVVLAGPAVDGPIRLDLYPDLHVRGLTLVGILPPEP
jgi:threonine dehydrogenase-like Zn-dependent dehydrogenase